MRLRLLAAAGLPNNEARLHESGFDRLPFDQAHDTADQSFGCKLSILPNRC